MGGKDCQQALLAWRVYRGQLWQAQGVRLAAKSPAEIALDGAEYYWIEGCLGEAKWRVGSRELVFKKVERGLHGHWTGRKASSGTYRQRISVLAYM